MEPQPQSKVHVSLYTIAQSVFMDFQRAYPTCAPNESVDAKTEQSLRLNQAFIEIRLKIRGNFERNFFHASRYLG